MPLLLLDKQMRQMSRWNSWTFAQRGEPVYASDCVAVVFLWSFINSVLYTRGCYECMVIFWHTGIFFLSAGVEKIAQLFPVTIKLALYGI